MNRIVIAVFLLLFSRAGLSALPDEAGLSVVSDSSEKSDAPEYVKISVEKMVIDTQGLIEASSRLSKDLTNLSNSIKSLSAQDIAFGADERATILAAARSLEITSQAITELSQQLPLTAKTLSEKIPSAINNVQQPMQDLYEIIRLISKTSIEISQSLPTVIEKSRLLLNGLVDYILMRVYGLSLLFITLVLIVFAGFIYLGYRKTILPVLERIDEFKSLPSQLAEMSGYLKITSENLLELEQLKQTDSAPDLIHAD